MSRIHPIQTCDYLVKIKPTSKDLEWPKIYNIRKTRSEDKEMVWQWLNAYEAKK